MPITQSNRTVSLMLLLVIVLPIAVNWHHSSAVSVLSYKPVIGAVTDTEAKIYFRTNQPAQVQVEYGLNPDLSDGTLFPSTPLSTMANNDFTGHIALATLTPHTVYYYRVVVDTVPDEILSFKTFIPALAEEGFSFATFSDSHNLPDNSAVYNVAAQDNPAFVLQIGDFSHQDPGNKSPKSIANWWNNNREALAASFFGPQFTSTVSIPFVHTWDDHDYGTNGANKTAGFKALATQAFKDYFPTYDLPNPDAGIWHSFRYGQAELFVLDTRSQRDALTEDVQTRSMLAGDAIANDQKTWFKEGLLNSPAKWKFVFSSVPLNASVLKKGDVWDGFPIERQELIDFIRQNNITDVIFYSGDIHSGGGIDDGTYAGVPEVAVPHTNRFEDPTCVADGSPGSVPPICGYWSEGINWARDMPSEVKGGYVLTQVGLDDITFIMKDHGGNIIKRVYLDAAGRFTQLPNDLLAERFALAVVSPRNGNVLGIGGQSRFEWNHNMGRGTYVKVELSRNGGTSWEVIAPSVINNAANGYFVWNVTGPSTTQALMRVSNGEGNGTVTSPLFTIADPQVTVVIPNSQVNWALGSDQTIKWKHNLGTSAKFRIEASRDDGSTFETIASNISGQAYNWRVNGLITTQALIKISVMSLPASDVSNVTFSILNPTMTVTLPNGVSEMWTVGSSKMISWSSNLGGQEKVNIELSKDGGLTYEIMIKQNTPSDGRETVVIQSSWISPGAKVRITWVENSTVTDESDNNFVIQ